MSSENQRLKVQVPKPSSVGRAYRRTKRVKDVLAVLARNGLGDMVDVLKIERRKVSGGLEAAPGAEALTRPQRVRQAIEELGPTFVKLGQVLSTRSDLMPAPYLAELEKLQDDVPPFDYDLVAATVERELGASIDEVFDDFETEPLASASLGQVHRARFQGLDVAVKVQRPDVRRTIEADIELMTQLAVLLERHVAGWEAHEPTRVVREFADTIDRELDYEVEAAHQERFGRQFEDDPLIFVPAVYREASTSHVLTMDFVDGVKVSDQSGLDVLGADRKKVAQRGFRLVLEQALIDGFFHADPHPGNIFVLPDDVICFIDFGMMGRLSQKVRDEFVELIYHVVHDDAPRVTRSVMRLATQEGNTDLTELEREVSHFIDSYMGRPLEDLDLTRVLREILQALSRHQLRVPPDLFLMLKAMSEIESLAVALDPDFDLVAAAKPYVRRIFIDRFRPKRVAEDLAGTGRELVKVLGEAPDLLHDLSEQARRGELRIKLEQEHTTEMFRVGDRIGNRLSFAFVLGSSLVGSAVIAAAEIPPLWNGISVLGLGGFLVSLAMSFWLLLSILRHGRL